MMQPSSRPTPSKERDRAPQVDPGAPESVEVDPLELGPLERDVLGGELEGVDLSQDALGEDDALQSGDPELGQVQDAALEHDVDELGAGEIGARQLRSADSALAELTEAGSAQVTGFEHAAVGRDVGSAVTADRQVGERAGVELDVVVARR